MDSLRLVQARPEGMQRLHMFEYMNRQLIWRGLADFCLFFLTVVDVRALGRRIRGAVRARRKTRAADLAANKALAERGRCPLCSDVVGELLLLCGR